MTTTYRVNPFEAEAATAKKEAVAQIVAVAKQNDAKFGYYTNWPYIGTRVRILKTADFKEIRGRIGFIVGRGPRYVSVAIDGMGIYPVYKLYVKEKWARSSLEEQRELAQLLLQFADPSFLHRRHHERSDSDTPAASAGPF